MGVMMIGANLRFGSGATSNGTAVNGTTRVFTCHPGGASEAGLLLALATLGIVANLTLILFITGRVTLRRWSQGLVLHQAAVDCARAALLIPLGLSILNCQPFHKCSLLETAFLLLVSVSSVNMLTTVLNDTPMLPEDDARDFISISDAADDLKPLHASPTPSLMDAPQCVLFGIFMIWFSAITINLGPTFISGALAANAEVAPLAPACPLVQGPYRHYIVNLLWVVVNLLCVFLTLFHLYKLHKDLTKPHVQAVRVASLVTTMISVSTSTNAEDRQTENGQIHSIIQRMEQEGLQRVRMFSIISLAYLVFWGPFFFVIITSTGGMGGSQRQGLASSGPRDPVSHEVTLHIAFVHAFVNPVLFLAMHRGLREAALDLLCCMCWRSPWTMSAASTGAMPVPAHKRRPFNIHGYHDNHRLHLSSYGVNNVQYPMMDLPTPTTPPLPPLPMAANANRGGHMETRI